MIIKQSNIPWNKNKSQGKVYKTPSTFNYTNSTWRALRTEKLRINPYCQCEECNGKNIKADMVDHIIPIEQGGDPYDMNNLQSMRNHPCHDRKRAKEKNQKYKK